MKNKFKLIELNTSGIVCDNPSCDYEDIVEEKLMKHYVNKDCPKCGHNLLTEHDYDMHKKVTGFCNFLNVLAFPFLLLIGGKKEKDCTTATYHYHNGKTTIIRHGKEEK